MSFSFNAHGKLISSTGQELIGLTEGYDHPFYAYDLAHMVSRARFWQNTFAGVDSHYAMKANAHPDVLKAFKAAGLKVDVVSGGEIEHALECGFQGSDIIFSGVGKTREEIRLSLDLGLKQINVESPAELERIGQIARAEGKVARVAFRMNPDVDAKTHPYITTGFRENKFGMDDSFLPELVAILKRYPRELNLVGLTLHIGSQLLDLKPLEEAMVKTVRVWQELRAQGFDLQTFDFGGGVGIQYTTSDETLELEMAREYGRIVERVLKPLGAQLLCEPGRFLVARGGALISQVQYIKQTKFKRFCILDSGMTHLMRPTLYEAYHRIEPLVHFADRTSQNYDVVGPICESSDFFAKDRLMSEMRPDEFMAILDAGAYGAVMASEYNKHGLPVERLL